MAAVSSSVTYGGGNLYPAGASWTSAGTLTVGSFGAVAPVSYTPYDPPVVAARRTNLEWLDDEVEAVCRLARAS